MFIPLELIIIGFDPPPYGKHQKNHKKRPSGKSSALLAAVDFELLRSALFLNGRDDWPQATNGPMQDLTHQKCGF